MFGSSLPPPPLPCLPFCFFGLRTFFFFMPAWVRDVALSFGLVGFGRSFFGFLGLRFSFFSASAAGAFFSAGFSSACTVGRGSGVCPSDE